MSRELAIVRSPGYGLRDVGYPVLWFEVRFGDSSGALQVFPQPKADEVIKDFGVDEVQALDGKPCFVVQEGGRVKFAGAAKL